MQKVQNVILIHPVQYRKKINEQLHCSTCLSKHAAAELTTMAQGPGWSRRPGLLVCGLVAGANALSGRDNECLWQRALHCHRDRQAEIYRQIVRISLSYHLHFDDQWATNRPHYPQRSLPSQQLGQTQNLTVILVIFAMPIFETREWEVPGCCQSRLSPAPLWVSEVWNWFAILSEMNCF